MKHNIKKEKWVDDALGSIAGISRAQPPDGMFEKITSKLNAVQTVRPAPALPVKQWIAAAVILLSLNISTVLHYTAYKDKTAQMNPRNPVATEIQSVTTYNY
jgi:hypothetical protein